MKYLFEEVNFPAEKPYRTVLQNMRIFYLSLLFVFSSFFLLSGCGLSDSGSKQVSAQDVVTVKNAGRTLIFENAPQRIVSLNQSGTEIFLALSLGDSIVGTAYNHSEPLPRFSEEYEKIPQLADQYPSLEVLLETNPDFVYGFKSAFTPPDGPATLQRLEELGIQAYVDRQFWQPEMTLKDVYEEFRILGRIFRVEEQANQVVRKMKKEIGEILSRLNQDRPRWRVAVYYSGKNSVLTTGTSHLSSMIEKLGGVNVFKGDLNQVWGRVSWETFVEREPDVIVIQDYQGMTAEEKIEFLRSKSALKEVPAIEKERFVVVPLVSVFTGPRNVEAIRILAKGMYPDSFGKSKDEG